MGDPLNEARETLVALRPGVVAGRHARPIWATLAAYGRTGYR